MVDVFAELKAVDVELGAVIGWWRGGGRGGRGRGRGGVGEDEGEGEIVAYGEIEDKGSGEESHARG